MTATYGHLPRPGLQVLPHPCCSPLRVVYSGSSSQKELPHEPGREWEKQRGKETLLINMLDAVTEARGGHLEKPEEEAMGSFRGSAAGFIEGLISQSCL